MTPHDTNAMTNYGDEREALLTAYALGETDPAQTAAVDALLADDAGARAQVEEIRATAALLTTALAGEAPEHLPQAARDAVTAAAEEPVAAGRVHSLWPLVGMAASIAAGVGLAGWLSAGSASPGPVREVASSNGPIDVGWGPSSNALFAGDGTDIAGQRDAQSQQLEAAVAAAAIAEREHAAGEERLDVLQNSSDSVMRENASLERQLRKVAEAQPETRGDFGELTEEVSGDGKPSGTSSVIGHLASADPADAGAAVEKGGTLVIRGGADTGLPSNSAGSPGAGAFFGRSSGTDGGAAPGATGRLPPPDGTLNGHGVPQLGVGGGGGGAGGRSEDAARGQTLAAETRTVRVEQARAQLERVQNELKIVVGGAGGGAGGGQEIIAAAGYGPEQVAVIRRFVDSGVLAADQDVAEAVAVYDGVLADVRRVRTERFRDRVGITYGIPGAEDYAHPGESTFRDPADEPLSTFSIDVDTASYANVRRFLNNGQLPPPAAVRVEEMVNYFRYSDPAPVGDHPIAATLETATCPWNTRSRLVRVGIKAKTFDEPPPAANLVFLIDVSGSMQPADKLPLLQRAMKMLADQMREGDRVAIVTYASSSGVRLESTDGSQKDAIKACIDGLSAGGSTNGGSGIVDAYRIAQEHFVEGGINRVVLATDGDFNVGVTDRGELTRLVEEKAKGGVFLSVLGVGTGNLKDATLESLADRGNGNYHYLDGLREARKVLVDDLMGTVVTVAKDVKIQIEFNPVTVGAYRLIGYENRMLAAADFNDDTKDAGEMGAGHTVTALYEVVPAGRSPQEGVDPLRYQKSPPAETTTAAASGEMLTLKVRYKQPEGSESTKFEMSLTDSGAKYDEASEDLRFASAVASFGMLLRGSPAAAGTSYEAVLELAQGAIGEDPGGHRAELLDLVLKAKTLSGR